MIKLVDFKEFWEQYIELISDLKHIFLVASEAELTKKISSVPKKDIFLAVITPSADRKAKSSDNMLDMHTLVFYILSSFNRSEVKDDEYYILMDKCAEAWNIIDNRIQEEFRLGTCQIFGRIDWNSLHIDPEENFLGCNGYSVSFKFDYAV